jgi:hypothetical protein
MRTPTWKVAGSNCAGQSEREHIRVSIAGHGSHFLTSNLVVASQQIFEILTAVGMTGTGEGGCERAATSVSQNMRPLFSGDTIQKKRVSDDTTSDLARNLECPH